MRGRSSTRSTPSGVDDEHTDVLLATIVFVEHVLNKTDTEFRLMCERCRVEADPQDLRRDLEHGLAKMRAEMRRRELN